MKLSLICGFLLLAVTAGFSIAQTSTSEAPAADAQAAEEQLRESLARLAQDM